MKKIRKSMWLLAFTCLLFSACQDEEVPPPTPPAVESEKVKFLTGKKWRMIANTETVKLGAAEPVTISLFDLYSDCVKDNLEVFAANKTYSIDEGTTKCEANAPQVQNAGTWELIENDSKLKNIYPDGTVLITAIKELTATTLKFHQIETATYPNGTVETTTTESTYQGQ
jgi:Lipocalin-like domain